MKILSSILIITLLTSIALLSVGATKFAHSKSEAFEASIGQGALIVPPSSPFQVKPSEQTSAPAKQGKTDVIVLTKRNSITFRGVVEPEKVAQVQLELMRMSSILDSSETIYLVLDTPGGSVDAGLQLIDTVKSLPQKVKTITVFAASMGFQMVQNMDERLIVPSGTLMSHRARGGMQGEIPGEFIVRLNHLLRTLHRMDAIAATRMSMDVKTYQDMIRDEYWVSGQDAVQDKAADRVVYVRCDSSLSGTTDETLGYYMGIKISGTMSNCPVVTGVLAVTVSGSGTDEAKVQAVAYGKAYRDRELFVREYILKNH